MRIGLEMFGTQTASRNRGIGRYCRNLASALLAEGPGSGCEFVLYAAADRPTDLIPTAPHAALRRLRSEPTLRATVARLVHENPDRLDALILLNPLELNPGYDIPPKPVAGGPRIAAVVYDLIPLLFQDGYLRRWPGALQGRRYFWALERLRTYDALLAISEATRDDVVRLLSVPAGRVITIGTGGDGHEFTFTPGDDATDHAAIRALGLDEPFIFSVTAADPRKNLAGLIDAFSRLPEGLCRSHRLAVTAELSTAEAEDVRRQAGRLGVLDALALTGSVDDTTLRALYRRCAAFVFPSLYEGFGLPILEALQCGAAVVAGRNSSQPEAAGDAALLVNAADPAAISEALARILTDPQLTSSLRAKGPAQGRKFCWDTVAVRTIDALEQTGRRRRAGAARIPVARTVGGARPTRDRVRDTGSPRPRLAFVSPLPPTPPGVANDAAPRLDAPGDRAAIDLFHRPGAHPLARFQSRGSGCFDARLFARLDRVRPYDAVIYQAGTSSHHCFIDEFILNRPGVVVLRDVSPASALARDAVRRGDRLEHARGGRSRSRTPPRPEVRPRGPGNRPVRTRARCVMKRLSKALWDLTGPLRRPIQDRIARFLTDCAAKALERGLTDEVTQALERGLTDEVALVLDTLVAEQFRLQERVERLELLIREALAAHDGLAAAVAAEDDRSSTG